MSTHSEERGARVDQCLATHPKGTGHKSELYKVIPFGDEHIALNYLKLSSRSMSSRSQRPLEAQKNGA